MNQQRTQLNSLGEFSNRVISKFDVIKVFQVAYYPQLLICQEKWFFNSSVISEPFFFISFVEANFTYQTKKKKIANFQRTTLWVWQICSHLTTAVKTQNNSITPTSFVLLLCSQYPSMTVRGNHWYYFCNFALTGILFLWNHKIVFCVRLPLLSILLLRFIMRLVISIVCFHTGEQNSLNGYAIMFNSPINIFLV